MQFHEIILFTFFKLSFRIKNLAREREHKFRKPAARVNENGPLQVAVLLLSRLLGTFLVRELSLCNRF